MAALPGFSLARRLAAGETVYTGWCALPAPIVAETIAREGFNTVTIDQQHGLWDTEAMVTAIAAIRAVGAAPVVRVPLGAFAAASRSLDFGAEGNSSSCRYPGVGPVCLVSLCNGDDDCDDGDHCCPFDGDDRVCTATSC